MREVQSLARGLQIIELLADSDDGLANKDIADRFEIHKSVASRFLNTLTVHGFAKKDQETGRYIAGSKIVRLSRKMLSRMPIRDQAKPFLRELVEVTGECAHLAIHVQGGALIIDQVQNDLAYQVSTEVGTIVPLYCTSIGKVILAFSDVPIPEKLERLTPRTIIDPDILKAHLEQVKKLGYATDDEEEIVGVRCAAAPVFGIQGKLIASVGVSGPTVRIPIERLPILAQDVANITEKLSNRMRFMDQ